MSAGFRAFRDNIEYKALIMLVSVGVPEELKRAKVKAVVLWPQSSANTRSS